MTDQQQAAPQRTRSILIIGPPRGGTTVIQNLMGTCFRDVYVPRTFEVYPRRWRASDAGERYQGENVVCFKVPEMPWRSPGEFHEYLEGRTPPSPDGEHNLVLGIQRDPRSLLTSRQNGRDYWTELAFDGTRLSALERWERMSVILAGLRRGQQQAEAAGRRSQFHLIRYEDLLREPNRVQVGIAKWAGLVPRVVFSEGYKHMRCLRVTANVMNGIRPLDPARGEPLDEAELRRRHGFVLQDHHRDLLEAFGYPRRIGDADGVADIAVVPRPGDDEDAAALTEEVGWTDGNQDEGPAGGQDRAEVEAGTEDATRAGARSSS